MKLYRIALTGDTNATRIHWAGKVVQSGNSDLHGIVKIGTVFFGAGELSTAYVTDGIFSSRDTR